MERKVLGIVSLSDYLRIKKVLDSLDLCTNYWCIDQSNIIITGEGLVILLHGKQEGIIKCIPSSNEKIVCYLSIKISNKVLNFPVSKII